MNKIKVTDKAAKKIVVMGTPMRRIEPKEFAAALGAEPIGKVDGNPDLIDLIEMGNRLIRKGRTNEYSS